MRRYARAIVKFKKMESEQIQKSRPKPRSKKKNMTMTFEEVDKKMRG